MAASTEHRTFILMLDADDGQDIAVSEGFTAPSDDVAEREQRQVMKDWALLDAEGLLPLLMEYAHWFTRIVVPEDADPEEIMTATQSFVTFAAASIGRLKARGYLQTPENKRLIPIVHDQQGVPIEDAKIPEELMEYAAEMFEWQNRSKDERG
jgi:hypothetical protein